MTIYKSIGIRKINVNLKERFKKKFHFLFFNMGNKIQMPSGMGGLVRYYDEYKSKLEFKPGTIILFIVLYTIFLISKFWLYKICY